MKSEFTIAEVMPGKLNALVKHLMYQMKVDDPNEAVRLINSGEWAAIKISKWREQDGVIYFSITSNGKTGPQWIKYFEKKVIQLSSYSKSILLSDDFKPTKDVTTEIAVLKGMLFTDDDRITLKIRAEAERRGLSKPNAEVACLIWDKFSDDEIKAMGLWTIVAMHEPIEDSDGDPNLLGAHRGVDGCQLSACYGKPGGRWDRGGGFAFAVSQVSAQA